MGQIGLTKASVLYIGSAVPLETAVGIESIQMPCRDRYTAAIGPDMKVAGIDATLTVFSSGITMQVMTSFVARTTSAPADLTPASNPPESKYESFSVLLSALQSITVGKY